MLKYKSLYHSLKKEIQQGTFIPGDLLPSENELCDQHQITRTTARKALDELQREGFIERLHGKGSQVRERRKSLGLLNVKGFSEAVGQQVDAIMLQVPDYRGWSDRIQFSVKENEQSASCIHFERLRCVNEEPVMLENNWFASTAFPDFCQLGFVDGSFFKSLSQCFFIEVVGSEQEIRAEAASSEVARLLRILPGDPVLHISICFRTSHSSLTIYSELYCNTTQYPIGNSYHL
ncbi:MAG: GntR family transcriptional regulator [Cyclobacteriaceae bacterium]